jgi:membrane associated rhomboid family serine protease
MSLPQPPTSTPTLPRCYRHPEREAGRSCTRCGKSACSDCLVQAAVGSHCLDCAKASRPDVKTKVRFWNARQPTLVTYALMAINTAVFIYVSVKEPDTLSGRGGVTSTGPQFDLGLAKFFIQDPQNDYYRLVTSGFLHFGIIHLAFNMLLLFQLGQMLERVVGRVRFALLYAAGLLGGSLGVVIMDTRSITGGASGAVFGLMAAAAVGLHRQGVNVFSTGIGTTLLLNLFITFAIPGISIGGHLGGAAAGVICGFVMMAPKWKAYPKWATYATPAVVAIASVLGSIAVARS